MTKLQAALDYAARGWRLFPLHGIVNGACTCGRPDCSSAGKHPLVRHGLHEATTDANQIRSWWHDWRSANIGIVTGNGSGIVVVDVDLPRAVVSLSEVGERLPRTLTGLTGGGGLHLIYRARHDHRLHNRTSYLPGLGRTLGVDLRADGGYIVAPPSRHASGGSYEWLDADADIADAPAWLKEPPPREIVLPPAGSFTGAGTSYGLAALEGLLDELRTAPIGTRNNTLYRVTRRIVTLAEVGHLHLASALQEIEAAAVTSGLDPEEVTRMTGSAGLAVSRRDVHRRPCSGAC